MLPQNYSVGGFLLKRNNQDNFNAQLRHFLYLSCFSSKDLNDRYVGDLFGYFICITNIASVVMVMLQTSSILSPILYLSTREITYLSDYSQNKLLLLF